MIEIMRSNNPVDLSFAESLLKDRGIECFIADQAMSIMEGTIGIIQRRLLVNAERETEARLLLSDAGLGKELR